MPSNMANNWLLVVSCVFSVLLAIVYLFYSNRIMACIIGYILHLQWWNEESDKAWVSLESFQVSLLAGRIMMNDLRYHSSNQSFRTIKCSVTWRYWVWRTRAEFNVDTAEEEGKENAKASMLPCRVHISLEGVEWWLYNRTAAYNDILLRMQRQSQDGSILNRYGSPISAQSHDVTAFASEGGDATSKKTAHLYPPSSPASPVSSRLNQLKGAMSSYFATFKPNLHEILPIDFKATHGAIVCGNPSTPSLFVAKFSDAQGSYGVVASKSRYDKYKTVIDAKFQNVKLDMERNSKYRGSLVQHGKIVFRRLGSDPIIPKLSFSAFTRLWTHQRRRETQHKIDDTHARIEADQEREPNDYAIVENILETPQLEMSYYWDEPGVVPSGQETINSDSLESHDVGNGDIAPQYGIDFVVNGGTARYGPWADRQRVALQRLFFPPTYQNVEPTANLKPGDIRIYTALKIFIELRDTITFHLPFKEPSKDWQFDEAKFFGSSRKRREAGWLEVHAGGNSTISCVLPWVATKDSFNSLLELHLDEVTALSSVNDIRLLTAESSKVLCQLPTHLRWNDSCQWSFDISFKAPNFHLIRDHITLLTDLVKDWSSGPPSDFDRWIPMHYVVNVSLRDYEVNLYLNDHNIITHPHARDANTLLSLRGVTLRSMIEIPSTLFRPQHTTIPFWVEAPSVSFSLTLPKWNTHSIFANSRTNDFGRVGLLRVDASFLYYSETLSEYIDQLKLDISARDVVFISFGWVVRHLMSVRDNYFGNFTHFSTLTEYVTKRNQKLPVGDPVEWKWREGKSNVFEVTLGVLIEDSVIILPAGLPGYEHSLDQPSTSEQRPITESKRLGTCAVIFQPELQVQLRTHDYSMELSLNISPVTMSVVENLTHNLARETYQGLGRQKIQVDGISILANRLFGPQPRTSTYLCLWELQAGAITGVASTTELMGLSAAITSFRLNFTDEVNAPASGFAIAPDPDVTFLKLSLRSLDVAWATEEASVQLCLPQGVKLDYNDLAGVTYKKLTEVRVPQAVVRALACSGFRRQLWLEAGSVSFDVGMDIYHSPKGWREAVKAQTNFVARQDALTRRARFLYAGPLEGHSSFVPSALPPSMFLPHTKLPCQPHEPHTRRHRKGSSQKLRNRPNAVSSRMSESDEEDHISEADRDARLAHSRPATPLLFNTDYEDRSMSSSDESDNGDVTSNVSDTDSDMDEFHAGSMGFSSALLSHYRNIVKQYESHMDDSWSPSLFDLVRDLTPPLGELHFEKCPSRPPTYEGQSSYAPQDEGTTLTIRLIRSNHIGILVTPLCLHVMKRVSDEFYYPTTSIELVVDSFTKTYLSDAPSEKHTESFRNTIDAEVSSLRLRILQNLMAFDETVVPVFGSYSLPTAPPVSPGTSRIISDMVLTLYGLSTSLSTRTGVSSIISKPAVIFRGYLSHSDVHLDTTILHTLSRMNRNPKVNRQCTLVINESKIVSTSSNAHVRLGDMHVQFLGDASSEMVAATADSLGAMIKESQTTYAKRASHLIAARQQQIWGILQSCRSIPVGDPLAQTQPSFLVQLGRPLRMRSDASWKLFMYLRHCLRFLGTSHRKILMKMPSSADTTFPDVSMDDLSTILLEKLPEWGHELSREEVAHLPFIQYCFTTTSRTPTDKPRDFCGFLPALSLYSGIFSFTVFEGSSPYDRNLGNTFSLGPIHIMYRHRSKRIAGNVSGPATGALIPNLDSAVTLHRMLIVVADNIRLTIHPTFIIFLQRLLPLHGKYFRRTPSTPPGTMDSPAKSQVPDDYWECFAEVKQISIQAAVEGMVLEVGLTEVSLVTPLLCATFFTRAQHMSRRFISGNGLVKFSQLYMRVRQAQDKTDPFSSNGRDTLTTLSFSSLSIDASYRITEEHPPVIHGMLVLDSVMLSVPRSALLTYRLIEEWRTQYLPHIHAMTQDLLSEIEKRRKQRLSSKRIRPTRHTPFPFIEFQTSVKRVGMSLQVMHGTWFSWDVHDIVGFLRSTAGSPRSPQLTFGVQLASQLLRIGAQPDEAAGKTAKTIKLALPSFRASGHYDGMQLRSHAVIDQFSLTLKPKYMDDILVVQQNLGTHFYDVLDLVAESRRNRPVPTKSRAFSVKYDVAFMLQGFRVGIEGPTTTLDLTSAQMTGTATNEHGLAWDFAVSNLALALSHHSTDPRPRSGFDRSLRSAYMVLDVSASSFPTGASQETRSSHVLRLQVSRMHAVMSPNSIGELGDLIDHVQAEKHLRQEQRALELEEMKNKTKRVMRAFEVQKPKASLTRSSSLLGNRTVLIDVSDIGIAFPLALSNEIEVDAIGSVPAFLISIKIAAFSVKRNESGHASMGGLSFQFIKQFDQSRSSQFDGGQHESHNRLLYPGMKAEFRSGASTVTRQWQIAAFVEGFVLDLDPEIVDNVFGIIDVYHRGRERVDKLTTNPQGSKLDSDGAAAASLEASYLAMRTSNILVTLVFHTGELCLHGPQANKEHTILPDEVPMLRGCPEVIQFPTITVWGEYRATPAASKVSSFHDQEPSALIFRSQVHTTMNRIEPSIFPFLIGFAERIEDRFRCTDTESSIPEVASSDALNVSTRDDGEFLASGVLQGIQLSFSLRIDSSRLELDCGYDLGVVAALHWESGGFLVTLSPRTRVIHFAGSVTGLQVDLRHLRHQAGTVQTAHVDARNLAFSVSYTQTDNEQRAPTHLISVVVDTEFGAAFRFDRLQDILIFKAIYIDRLPGNVPQPPVKPSLAADKPREGIPGLTTAVLVRARHIRLLVDLGHNVAAAVIDLETLVLQSRFARSVTDLSVSIARTNLDLEEDRPLGGYMRLPDFSFATVRRSDVRLGIKDGISKMLDVTLTSGTLDIVLQSEKRTLLQYHAKPFDIRIVDDWTAIDWNLLPEERTLRLDFSVKGTDILAVANLQSIPRIIMLLAKLRSDLKVQQTDARNALTTSSIAQLPKPDNALAEVADAMIRSARSKFSDGPAFSYIVVQQMKLKLSSLRLVLFKTPNDMEMALFEGKDVHAELERLVHSHEMPPSRSLKLAFSSLYLSKYTSLKYRAVGEDLTAAPWVERLLKGASEWTIARVPAMNLEMNSDVEYEGRQEVLLYDLVATADERAQSSRSIYVSLNLSLYIWAGALVKGLGVEVDKALVATGFNKPATKATAPIASPPSLSPSKVNHNEVKSSDDPHSPEFVASTVPAKSPTSALVSANSQEAGAPLPRKYHARSETSIDYGTIQQLGEATPDAKAPWLGLKETVPPRVHEYATLPMEVFMKMLLEVYSKQLKMATGKTARVDASSHDATGGEYLD